MYPSELSKKKLMDLDVLILRNCLQGPLKWKTCTTLATKRPLLSWLTPHSCLLLYFFISCWRSAMLLWIPASDSAGRLLNCQGWLRNLLTYKLLRWLGNVNSWQSLLTEEISYCCHILQGLRLMILIWLEVWLLLFTRRLHKDHFSYGDDCDIAVSPRTVSILWLTGEEIFILTHSFRAQEFQKAWWDTAAHIWVVRKKACTEGVLPPLFFTLQFWLVLPKISSPSNPNEFFLETSSQLHPKISFNNFTRSSQSSPFVKQV